MVSCEEEDDRVPRRELVGEREVRAVDQHGGRGDVERFLIHPAGGSIAFHTVQHQRVRLLVYEGQTV